ncbi:MAG: hypothetical protein YFSK_5400 [Candidatus Yanofskyibacterium parasiticum]|jgi:predicted RNase H-like HicB family nuclease|nr:MAG: hypothetical protein YFSK_5400 [Candidatus Yanofskybacteria bacterium]
MNSKNLAKNNIRCIVFREEKTWYGAALELNIVESGDTAREAMLLLFEAIAGYLESAKKINNLSVLNQKTDPEYEQMWQALASRKNIPAKEVFFFGNVNADKNSLIAV